MDENDRSTSNLHMKRATYRNNDMQTQAETTLWKISHHSSAKPNNTQKIRIKQSNLYLIKMKLFAAFMVHSRAYCCVIWLVAPYPHQGPLQCRTSCDQALQQVPGITSCLSCRCKSLSKQNG